MGDIIHNMLLRYALVFCLLALESEGSVSSVCLKLLLDDKFHVPCGNVPSTSKVPCLVSTAADYQYLNRFGIVSAPGGPTGQMVCAPHGETNNVDCVSTKLRINNKIAWMWTEWAPVTSGMISRTMYYMNNGAIQHCPYTQTVLPLPIVLTYTIDDIGAVYADGILIDDTVRWTTYITRNIPALTRLIAFKVINTGGPTGVVASLSNGVKSDTSAAWKCSQVYEDGWNQIEFDDSHWGRTDNQGYVGGRGMLVGCRSTGGGPFYFRRWLT